METPTWDSSILDDTFLLGSDTDKASLDLTVREARGALPTPPASDANTPDSLPSTTHQPTSDTLAGQLLVSVSTTFYPVAALDALPHDLILLSADSVFFNVHVHRLLSASNNGFAGLLPPTPDCTHANEHSPGGILDQAPIVSVGEASDVLNLILHAIYGLSCAHYTPHLDTLAATIDAAVRYGLAPKVFVAPGTPLFDALLQHAPLRPLDVYVLTAQYDLHELAVLTSSHLLSLQLASLTDEICAAMGAVYLKRLFFLHLGRADALKRLLLMPPPPHPPTPGCGFEERGKLTRAWALAAAYLAWDSRPDVLPSTIEATCRPLQDHLSCEQCKAALRERTRSLVLQWTMVKGTI